MKSIFRHGKDLKDVASESTLDILQIDVLEVLAHDLLRSIVDQDVDLAKLFDMLLDGFLASLVVHEISGEQNTLTTLLLNHLLGLFGISLLFGEVHDCHVSAFAGEEDGN